MEVCSGGEVNQSFTLMNSVFSTAAICKVDLHTFVLLTLTPKRARLRSLTGMDVRMAHTGQTCVFKPNLSSDLNKLLDEYDLFQFHLCVIRWSERENRAVC